MPSKQSSFPVPLRNDVEPAPSRRRRAGHGVDHASIGVSTLRNYLSDPEHPLPCYRLPKKVLVRRSGFDGWIAGYRSEVPSIHALADKILAKMRDHVVRPRDRKAGNELCPRRLVTPTGREAGLAYLRRDRGRHGVWTHHPRPA
jgi:hypothetical protein